MSTEITLVLKDAASPLLLELSGIVSRLEQLLSPGILAKVLNAFESISDPLKASGDFFRVVPHNCDASPAGTGEHVAEVQLSDRLRDFVATLRAFDRELELVYERHGFFEDTGNWQD